ncbi:rhamnan synthesis F family protein [Methylocystis heyeri]|nr:rhamnan synthesis F family protein [Methylocystis heyeri]
MAGQKRVGNMASGKTETTFQAVRRHLRNGYVILTERGIVALYGAAMRELAKIVDSPVGAFLAPKDIFKDGPELVRAQGLRVAFGAVLRQVAAEYDPPLGRSRNPVNAEARASAIRYHYTYELLKPDGVAPSRRPVNDVDYALEIPFAYAPRPGFKGPVAAVIHVFYPEVLPLILEKLDNIPCAVDLFLSSDAEEKIAQISADTSNWSKGRVEIRRLPNRGRDIGAKFVGFRDVYDRYEIFLHLHTKRSPHGGEPLARWRDYLIDNLFGTPEIAASNLSLFDDPQIGIVFPQHLFELRGVLNWGYDYNLARKLMRRIGVSIDKNLVLEFPSGSMFWGRSAAIGPLLEAGLEYSDFPEERGQIDGTLAHAIERCVLMAAESRGYEWLKVVRRDLYPVQKTVLPVTAPADIAQHRLKVYQPCLAGVDIELAPFARTLKETRPIPVYPSRSARARLNLIVPTINPEQTFGGVATALRLFRQIGDALGDDFDRRIIVTDAEIEQAAYRNFPGFVPAPFAASLDEAGRTIVDASEREGGRLDLRKDDVFVATAWWTAEFALGFESERRRFFGGSRPFVYVIQDDEPNFYGWSSKFVMAEATYRYPEDTIAIINSEELFDLMTGKYRFRAAFCLPYQTNERVAAMLRPTPKERIILVYGRPTVMRNAFELICASLCRWQQRDPIRASRWRILFLGEEFEAPLAYPVQNADLGGKATLEVYADWLNRASVGVSLMVSPHPSYPPLEMAEAGLLTIANDFPGKSLAKRCPDIVSLNRLDIQTLADAIEDAVAKMEPQIGKPGSLRALDSPQSSHHPLASPEDIAALLRAGAEQTEQKPDAITASALR